MATQQEILSKADEVTTSVVNNDSGGLMKPAQSNRFIDFVIDQSVLMQNSRVVRMRTPQMEIDKTSVGTRLLAKATEATDTAANAAVTFTKVSLSTVKLRLDWALSTESLEDNIEGPSLEDHIAQIMARQTANDMDDLFINGNTSHKKYRDKGCQLTVVELTFRHLQQHVFGCFAGKRFMFQ
jgi:HK97 family phage major capsid protein